MTHFALPSTTQVSIARCIALTLERGYHLSPEAVFQQAGVNINDIVDSDLRLPLSSLNRLWSEAARASGDEGFGLKATDYLRPEDRYGLDLLVHASRTLGEAVLHHCEFASLLSTAVEHHLSQDANGNWTLAFLTPEHGLRATCYARDLLIATYLRTFERQCGLLAREFLCAVHFAGEEAGAVTAWQQQGFSVKYNQACTALIFSNAYWGAQSFGGDVALLSHLQRPMAQQMVRLGGNIPMSALVLGLAELLTKNPVQRALADHLGLSEADVSRTLMHHGVSFNQVLDRTRHQTALRLLAKQELSIDEIALRVGLSKAGSLIRALHRWEGVTPKQWRAQQAQHYPRPWVSAEQASNELYPASAAGYDTTVNF